MNKYGFRILLPIVTFWSLLPIVVGSAANDDASHKHRAGDSTSTPIPHALVDHYIAIQESLAADSMVGVAENARSLVQAFGAIDNTLREAAERLSTASEIEHARQQFASLSAAVVRLISEQGLDEGEFHHMHCPMALDSRGASWIQKGTTVANPYFGSAMLRCGARRATLNAGSRSAIDRPEGQSNNADKGHNH